MGTRIRDGSKADLTGNDRGSKISFGQIIIGRDLAILSPVVETIFDIDKTVAFGIVNLIFWHPPATKPRQKRLRCFPLRSPNRGG